MTKKPSNLLTVPEAGEKYLGLSRNAAYSAARNGHIPTIRIGRILRVPVDAMERAMADAVNSAGDISARSLSGGETEAVSTPVRMDRKSKYRNLPEEGLFANLQKLSYLVHALDETNWGNLRLAVRAERRAFDLLYGLRRVISEIEQMNNPDSGSDND